VKSPQTIVDRPIPGPPSDKPATLPDLDERLAQSDTASRPDVESGANTLVFSAPQDAPGQRNRGADTNLLTGTAGARSEQSAPTSIMQMGRTTGPVEEEEATESQKSGDKSRVTTGEIATESRPSSGGLRSTSEHTVEFDPSGSLAKTPSTQEFGAGDSTSSSESEGKTAVFSSGAHAKADDLARAQDDIGTKEFAPPSPVPSRQAPIIEQTREIPAMGSIGNINPTRQVEAWPPAPVSPVQSESQPLEQEAAAVATAAPVAKGKGGLIASIIVIVLILGGAGFALWWFTFARPKPPARPVLTVEPPPAPAPTPEKPPAPVIPEGMVAITAGNYTIGRDDGDPIEQPQHKVDVRAFLIDRTEVTNASYKKFVDATGHKPPSNWVGSNYPEGRGDAPVTGVTWQDASDYATWAKKRLPTEAEWEAAARGADARIYPWGNEWRPGLANIGLKPDKPTAEQYPPGLRAVGGHPEGASPFGIVDMIGNAWEWVADEIKLYPGSTQSPLELDAGVTYRVIRGGAYDGSKVHDATYRGYLDGSVPYPKVGFRCAKDSN